MKLVRRLVSPLREFGPRVGALYLIDRALQAVSPRLGLASYEFLVQPVSDKGFLPPALARSFSFELLSPASADLSSMQAPASVVAQRFADGANCLAVYRKGVLLGYAWWSACGYLEQEVGCLFQLADPTTVFDFDLYVLPEHRMGLGFVALWHGINDHLRRAAVTASLSRVSSFNIASLRAHHRLGSVPFGRAWFLRLGGVNVMISTLSPRFAVGRAGKLRLQLTAPFKSR